MWGHGADVAILNTLLKSKPYANDFNAKLEKISEFIREEFKPSNDEGISVETLEKALVCVEDKLRDRQSFKGIILTFLSRIAEPISSLTAVPTRLTNF